MCASNVGYVNGYVKCVKWIWFVFGVLLLQRELVFHSLHHSCSRGETSVCTYNVGLLRFSKNFLLENWSFSLVSKSAHINYLIFVIVNAVILQKHSYNKSQRDALILKFILIKNSICFGQIYCPSSGVSTLYTQHCLLAWQIPIAVYTVLRLLMMDSRSVRNMKSFL
jgi:hypothetical protein